MTDQDILQAAIADLVSLKRELMRKVDSRERKEQLAKVDYELQRMATRLNWGKQG